MPKGSVLLPGVGEGACAAAGAGAWADAAPDQRHSANEARKRVRTFKYTSILEGSRRISGSFGFAQDAAERHEPMADGADEEDRARDAHGRARRERTVDRVRDVRACAYLS